MSLLKGCALAAFLLVSATLSAQTSLGFDRGWWMGISQEEQLGFVSGYLDCYIYDAHGGGNTSGSLQSYVDNVSQFYRSDTTDTGKSVPDLLRRQITARSASTAKSASSSSNSHSYFNGNYWRQLEDERRIGFVEGYASCRSGFLHDEHLKNLDSKKCASEISQWYGVDPADPSAINESRVTTQVSEIIDRCHQVPTQHR